MTGPPTIYYQKTKKPEIVGNNDYRGIMIIGLSLFGRLKGITGNHDFPLVNWSNRPISEPTVHLTFLRILVLPSAPVVSASLPWT